MGINNRPKRWAGLGRNSATNGFFLLTPERFCYPRSKMAADQTDSFKILGGDNVLYGPVELPMLVTWVQEERVLADTWVFVQSRNEWHKASVLPELKMFFQDTARSRVPAGYDTEISARAPGLKPG
jgi:hypothetical protein